VFSRLCDWRDVVVNVRTSIIIRWHRLGWRISWRLKCGAGRPPISQEIRQLIRRMAGENPLGGQERIANELLIKLGIQVSPRTVAKYMPKRPQESPRGDQRWSTFLRNHRDSRITPDGGEVHAETTTWAGSGRSTLVDVLEESREGECRLRLLRLCDGDLPGAVRIRGDRAWAASPDACECDSQSHC
jgi:hypothetical protein